MVSHPHVGKVGLLKVDLSRTACSFKYQQLEITGQVIINLPDNREVFFCQLIVVAIGVVPNGLA